MILPKEFIQSLDAVLGGESVRLVESLDREPSVSIRYNPFKIDEKPQGVQVPWCRYGFLLDERPAFTLDPMFHGGTYYVQEASSMFVEHLLRSTVDDMAGVRILDLCAAPGGKTTLLSSVVGFDGLVVANEAIRPRAMTLADNVRKWGLGNVVVTNNDPAHFAPLEHYFDVVVVDAPCSGEGMFRKNPEAVTEWSGDNVKLCAARQRRILSDVWSTLRPGGVLIYSTCTYNRVENEENIAWLQQEFDCQGVDVDVPSEWGIVSGRVGDVDTFRLYPHRLRGEGFFAVALRKGDGRLRVKIPKPRRVVFGELPKRDLATVERWVNQPDFMTFAPIGDNIYGFYADHFRSVKTIADSLTAIYSGVLVGQIFKDKLRPEHPLALFHDLQRDEITQTHIEKDDALNFLRKGYVDPELFTEGINLLLYNNTPIGWAKRIGQRINNGYPNELRIRNM